MKVLQKAMQGAALQSQFPRPRVNGEGGFRGKGLSTPIVARPIVFTA